MIENKGQLRASSLFSVIEIVELCKPLLSRERFVPLTELQVLKSQPTSGQLEGFSSPEQWKAQPPGWKLHKSRVERVGALTREVVFHCRRRIADVGSA